MDTMVTIAEWEDRERVARLWFKQGCGHEESVEQDELESAQVDGQLRHKCADLLRRRLLPRRARRRQESEEGARAAVAYNTLWIQSGE